MPKSVTRPVLKLKPKAERRRATKEASSQKKNNNKGSRWAKGHSCESNPSVTRFRDGISNLQFQLRPVADNSLLTMGNLEHLQNEEDMDEDYDVLSEDVKSLTVSNVRSRLGSVSSCKTFASGWSKCSNKAFDRFLTRFKVDSALHKDMLSILAATTEVINSFGGKHSDTEYFATFISALEKCEPQQYHPMMALLCIILSKVPEPIIRLKFDEIYPKISDIFAKALDANEVTVIRLCCDALGKILRTQECAALEFPEAEKNSAYYSILKCSLHDHPKVRRKGRQVIGGLLNRHNERNSNSLTKLVLGWILDQLASYPTCGSKAVSDVLSLLQFTWTFIETINPSASKKMFESVLRVLSGGETSIVKIGFTFFSTVFQKGFGLSLPNKMEDSLTPKLMTAIWERQPDWRNQEAFLGWIHCILNGVVRLSDEQNENGPKYLPLLIEAISPSWPSRFGNETCKILCEYLQHIVSENTNLTVIENCFALLSRNLIAIPPNPHCLTVLDSLLNTVLPSQYGQQSREVLLQLVPLYSTNTAEMSRTLGRFVKAFGVENLWNSVDTATKHNVILPLLRENLHQSNFTFWKENILPLASTSEANKESLNVLVWESFIGFCRDPMSVDEFPAEILGKTIATNATVRLSALSALRQFCQYPQSKSILEKYSKNYLPILFNLYIKEKVDSKDEATKFCNPGHAEAIGCTITDYLPFCPFEFIKNLLDTAFKKLTQDEQFKEEEKTPLLDLIANLVSQQIDQVTLERLMKIVSDLINDSNQQKRAYRILCALVKHENIDSVKAPVLQLLREGKGQAKSNAQALRLECLNHLIEKDPSLTDEFLPEAILNLLSVNMKARKLAVRFAVQSCHQYKSMEGMTKVIQLGLQSKNTFVQACTIHFMTLAHSELKPKQPNAELIQACLDQIRESKQIKEALKRGGADVASCKESLGFLSLNLSLFKTLMGPYASSIGHILSLPGNPRKEVNKILARMIKVFGVAGLKAVLPNANDPKMHIRIKNLQKKIRKLKESQTNEGKKLQGENGEDDGYHGESKEDASDESEDEFTGLSNKTSKRTLSTRGLVIKEGVVDFLDPKNITSALITKPKQSKVGDEFKLSEDGRLIIEMEEEMEKTGTKRKRKLESTNRDDDDDDDEDDEVKSRISSKKFHSSRSTKSYSSKGSSRRYRK